MLFPRIRIATLLLLLVRLSIAIAESRNATIEELDPLGRWLSPRYYEPPQAAQKLDKRQNGVCNATWHICIELGVEGASHCCPPSQYCYFDRNWTVSCCGLASNCDSPCSSGFILTNGTSTVTSTLPVSTTETGIQSFTVTEFTSPFTGCASRACSGIGSYKCPNELGGGCCPNDALCGTAGCILTQTTLATNVPTYQGCSGTASATSCTQGGGGCCRIGQTCTIADNTYGCLGTPDGPNGTNVTSSNPGLSEGAKAGIGAGVAVAAALVIGAVTYLCIRKRRAAASARHNPVYQNVPGDGQGASGAEGEAAMAGPASTPGMTGQLGMGSGDMSEISGPVRPGGHDYFGPAATVGPYTQLDHEGHESPRGPDRGVPVQPHGPGDIAAPVEIDSQQMAWPGHHHKPGSAHSSVAQTPAAAERGGGGGQYSQQQQQQGPFELLASLGTPSPLSPEDGPPSLQEGQVSPGGNRQFQNPESGLGGRDPVSPRDGTL